MSLGSETYGRVSYRQVGVRRGGKVQKGPPATIEELLRRKAGSNGIETASASESAVVKRTQPSIPSKYETSLHVNNGEKNAFGSRTTRFNKKLIANPGPGKYHQKTSLLKSPATCGSISKLGYSVGFVSKAKRFTSTAELDLAELPGPGAYNVKVPTRKSASKKGVPSAAFAALHSTGGKGFGPESETAPGPGSYYSESKRVRRNKPTSQFKSKTKRIRGGDASQKLPGPGQHDVIEAYKAITQGIAKSRKNPSAAFRSGTNRLKDTGGAATVPGPGYYSVENGNKEQYDIGDASLVSKRFVSQGVKRYLSRTKASSMFAGGTNQNRFGKSKISDSRDLQPGPGSYINVYKQRPKQMASSSYFVSGSGRLGKAGTGVTAKPPGPAYYNPEPMGKKSFLLNATLRFV